MELGYSGWMEFMKAQRIHYNYLENFMQVVTGIAMSGLHYPKTAAIWGGIYTLSRLWFNIGYKIAPTKRIYGAPGIMITQFALPIFTMIALS